MRDAANIMRISKAVMTGLVQKLGPSAILMIFIGTALVMVLPPGGAAAAGSSKGSCQVSFVGNKTLSSARLLSLLDASGCWKRDGAATQAGGSGEQAVRTWMDSTEARVKETVLDAYGQQGYLNASVDSIVFLSGAAHGRAVIHVSEGEPAIVGSVRFVGNRTIPAERLARSCGMGPGTELTEGVIEKACENIVSSLADAGLPFAEVEAGEFRLEQNTISFAFLIDEGPLSRVLEVKFENSRALKPRALQRALRIKQGDLYSEAELRQGLTELRRTGLFEDVGEPIVTPSQKDGVTISIPVKDKKTTSIGGAAGFRGRTNELTGALSLSVLNLARSGRSARASWEAMGSRTSSLRFLYTEPWLSGLPFSSSVSFEHMARDTFFAKTSLAVSLKIPILRSLSGQIGTSFEKTLNTDWPRSRATRIAWLAGTELFLGEPSWLSRNTLLTSLELSRGQRKRVYLNQSGRNQESESRSFSTLKGDALLQGRVWGNQICVLDASSCAVLEGREMVSGDELFPLGGKNTLRGYSERQFLAETVGSLQCEYGLAVGNDGGRAFVFLDCGYASTPATSTGERFHFGYGMGLRVPSLLGLAGIDLGIPAGESFSSGKIHVGIEGRF